CVGHMVTHHRGLARYLTDSSHRSLQLVEIAKVLDCNRKFGVTQALGVVIPEGSIRSRHPGEGSIRSRHPGEGSIRSRHPGEGRDPSCDIAPAAIADWAPACAGATPGPGSPTAAPVRQTTP